MEFVYIHQFLEVAQSWNNFMGLMGEMAEQGIWNCMKFEYVS